MRVGRVASIVASCGILAAATLVLAASMRDRFPHDKHARLFPLCVSCHAGIPAENETTYYPPPAACRECHDGQVEPVVEWTEPTREPSNLRFAHDRHAAVVAAAEADTAVLACTECHTQRGAPRMAVQPPLPVRCFECHGGTATEHFVNAACTVCHVPLVESALPQARLATLPVPSTHRRENFLASLHGELAAANPATCATCHAREQCLGCHVAVGADSPVERIPAAAGRLSVPSIAARYPVPASHLDPEWERRHGAAASRTSCGTCHTRESCTACHTGRLPEAAASLASGREAAAPGVVVPRRMPPSHSSAFFATQHGPAAMARPQSCASCHDRVRFCGACHEPGGSRSQAGDASDASGPAAAMDVHLVVDPAAGVTPPRHVIAIATTPRHVVAMARSPHIVVASDTPPPAAPAPRTSARRSGRGFHPPNYVLRHSAEAYGRRLDCSNCHNAQLFCRDCHQSVGRGSVGRLGPGYHDAEPVWLLRHGQAARQTLESCTTCHTQRNCMQCHSQFGSFRVNPHGPGFDARRAQRANPQICGACHLGNPLAPP